MVHPNDVVQALRPVVAEFNRLGVRYYITVETRFPSDSGTTSRGS